MAVGKTQAASCLQDVTDRRLRIQLSLLFDQLVERLAFDEFHAVKIDALISTQVINLHHVVMRQLSRGIGLARETGDSRWILTPLCLDRL